jgi:hypothetical protein
MFPQFNFPKKSKQVSYSFSLLFMILIDVLIAHGQLTGRPMTASYLTPASYSSFHADVFGFIINPAILGRLKQPVAGIHSERRFLLKELTQYKLALAFQTSMGNFGMEASQSGTRGFREAKCGFAHGRALGPRIELGVQFNFETANITGYGNSFAITAKVGMLLQVTENLKAGWHILNPAGARFGLGNSERYPTIYTAGFGYEPSNRFLFVIEFIKQDHLPTSIEGAIQYQFHPRVWARTGISTANNSRWIGWGTSWRQVRTDLILALHPYLGLSTGLILTIQFPGSKKKNDNKHG